MNLKAGIPKFSLALTLIGLTLGVKGNLVFAYVLAGVLILGGIIVSLEKANSHNVWKTAVEVTKGLDLTYFAFGLGMISLSQKMLIGSFSLAGILLLLAGAAMASLNTVSLLGKGASDILAQDSRVAIVFGGVVSVGGATWFGLSWDTANTNLLSNLNNVSAQFVLVCYGTICMVMRCRKSGETDYLNSVWPPY